VKPACILTLAGSDSGGGAGIQADLKTIAALGGFGLTVITALTAQNSLEVRGVHAPPPEFAALQLAAVLDDFPVAAAKTGMLFSAGVMEVLAPGLRGAGFPLVVDPVCVSQSGYRLLEEDAVQALRMVMLPLADLLTPNRPEAELLTGLEFSGPGDAAAVAGALHRMGARAVLLKGGHFPEQGDFVTDFLCLPGAAPEPLPQPRVDTRHTHGTGCTLSAAIACGLGQGLELRAAILRAQAYLNAALRAGYALGRGYGPPHHLHPLFPAGE
jgi:hydroxymethylpyrimidine/phosphomethylpyrimidine kinase